MALKDQMTDDETDTVWESKFPFQFLDLGIRPGLASRYS